MLVRQAVVTTLFGGYERLGSQPVASTSAADFLCFTDDPNLVSDDWQVMTVAAPEFPLDRTRTQRAIKIIGDPRLEGYDEVLYVDNSVLLTADPGPALHDWLRGVDVAFIDHSFRATLRDEFDVVLLLELDHADRVDEQLEHYSRLHPDALADRPVWSGMYAYRPGPTVREVMSRWYAHVLRYSRRDQLSWNVVVPTSSLRLRRLSIDNHLSDLHRWPVDVDRVPGGSRSGLTGTTSRERATRLARELEDTQAELTATRAELESRRVELDDVRAQASGLRRELERTRATVSWRVTAPLRRLRAASMSRPPIR